MPSLLRVMRASVYAYVPMSRRPRPDLAGHVELGAAAALLADLHAEPGVGEVGGNHVLARQLIAGDGGGQPPLEQLELPPASYCTPRSGSKAAPSNVAPATELNDWA